MKSLRKVDRMLTQLAGGMREGQTATSLQWNIDQLLDLRNIMVEEHYKKKTGR